MNNQNISTELRAQLTELIIKEGGKNPEITVKFWSIQRVQTIWFARSLVNSAA